MSIRNRVKRRRMHLQKVPRTNKPRKSCLSLCVFLVLPSEHRRDTKPLLMRVKKRNETSRLLFTPPCLLPPCLLRRGSNNRRMWSRILMSPDKGRGRPLWLWDNHTAPVVYFGFWPLVIAQLFPVMSNEKQRLSSFESPPPTSSSSHRTAHVLVFCKLMFVICSAHPSMLVITRRGVERIYFILIEVSD